MSGTVPSRSCIQLTPARAHSCVILFAENMDAVITVLTETPWDSELARVLEPRDSLYGLLQLRMPEARMGYSEDDKALAATGGRGKGGDTGEDDFSSYGALAREAGY